MESSIKLLNKASEVLAYKSAHSSDEQHDEIMNIRVNIASMYKDIVYGQLNNFPSNSQTESYLHKMSRQLLNDAQGVDGPHPRSTFY